MALKYPNVNFVMCHMGLATDNQEAIELIAKLPNLYGDTAWVRADMVYQAIKSVVVIRFYLVPIILLMD